VLRGLLQAAPPIAGQLSFGHGADIALL